MKKNSKNVSANAVKNNTTKVVCPNCGAEIAIPEHEHFVAGVAVGKDSGMGTIVLPAADSEPGTPKRGRKTAQDKLDELKAAGVDVSNLFAMTSATGNGMLARLEDGKLTEVADDDPVFAALVSAGTVPNRKLFRRFVAAHVLHMLTDEWSDKNFTEAMKLRGYEYTWRMVERELNWQRHAVKDDPENFLMRNMWFDPDLVVNMMEDYLEKLREHIDKLTMRHCKGVEYKNIHGRDVFVSDFEKVYFRPTRLAIRKARYANSITDLYKTVVRFNKNRVRLGDEAEQYWGWQDAFKAVGAFYTLQNLVRFSGLKLHNKGRELVGNASMSYLVKRMVETCGNNAGYQMLGMLKEELELNKVNINALFAKWKSEKAARLNY